MRRSRGVFVTGTDTGVGKTQVACALLRALAREGVRAIGMKPVAAGAGRIRGALDNADVVALAAASALRASRALRNPYLLARAIAPHLAAREAGVRLDVRVMAQAFRALSERAECVVVEGAGGFRVPLNERADLADLARALRLPVILVVGMRLGCLSHALLTAEAIRGRGLVLAGWVANRIDPSMRRYRDNVEALRERLGAPMLAELAHLPSKRSREHALDHSLDSHCCVSILGLKRSELRSGR
ncbi:MAG: dethiobiotin synthase [Burkholderiales bacterium]|nr:dethiobiotin synthase [Burkholderiales bacterium]